MQVSCRLVVTAACALQATLQAQAGWHGQTAANEQLQYQIDRLNSVDSKPPACRHWLPSTLAADSIVTGACVSQATLQAQAGWHGQIAANEQLQYQIDRMNGVDSKPPACGGLAAALINDLVRGVPRPGEELVVRRSCLLASPLHASYALGQG